MAVDTSTLPISPKVWTQTTRPVRRSVTGRAGREAAADFGARRGRLCGTCGVVISALLHAAATVVLAFYVFSPSLERRILLQAHTPQQQSESPVRMELATAMAAVDQRDLTETVKVEQTNRALLTDASLDRTANAAESLVAFESLSFGPLEQLPTSAGQGGGTGSGRRLSGADYYGIEATGNRFVYIVDSSSSMRGPRWNSARAELLRSIETLPVSAQCYVIFFSNETTLMFGERAAAAQLRPVVDIDPERLTRWVNGLRLGRSTIPLPAVQIALRLQPDAIFLLTDGEFRDNTARYVNIMVSKDQPLPPIHTIGLYSNAGMMTLQNIARLTGGKSVFVAN